MGCSRAYNVVVRSPRQLFVVGALAALAGCGGASPASEIVKVPEFKPEGQTKCKVTKSSNRPLIVEWPSADRGALEAQMKKGIVAVRYLGCEMQVLRRCRIPEQAYGYVPLTLKEDRIRIRNADELYANIPVYAAKFESKLETAGELTVDMTIVGSYEAERESVSKDELEGDCRGATHFIYAITAGAFEFAAVGSASVGAGVDVLGAGAGGESDAEREMLNRDGYKKACQDATNQDTAPPDGCGALLRVEVVALDEPQAEPEPAEPTEPTEPTVPAKPTEPGEPTEPPQEPTEPPQEPPEKVATRPKRRIVPDEPDEPAEPPSGPGIVRIHVESEDPVQLFRYKPVAGMTGVATMGMFGTGASLGTSELICTAPCGQLVDGRKGQQFYFAGEGIPESDKFRVHDKSGDLYVQVDAGSTTGKYWGWVGTLTGASLAVASATFFILGSTMASVDTGSETDDNSGTYYTIGGVMAGVGGGLLIGGIVLLATMGTDHEFVDGPQRAGATVPYAPPHAPPFVWRF